MEGDPFSSQNLAQPSLELEQLSFAQKIDHVQDFVKNEVQYSLLGDIFGELLRKSRAANRASMHGVTGENELIENRVKNVKEPSLHVEYLSSFTDKYSGETTDRSSLAHTDGKSISFSASFFFAHSKLQKNLLLKAVVHELVHVASFTGITAGISTAEKVTIGKQEKIINYFELLDEALTEMISDAVYSEYLARSGEIMNDEFKKRDDNGMEYGLIDIPITYYNARIQLIALINELTQATSSSEELVIQSLVGTYFRNGKLDDVSIKEAFADNKEILEYIEQTKRNLVDGITEDDIEYLEEDLLKEESVFTCALFGRDEIGRRNQEVAGANE